MSDAERRLAPPPADPIASAAQGRVISLRKEVEQMAQTVIQTWEEYMQEQANRQAREAVLRAGREIIRALLESRLGPLPESVVRHIEQFQDSERLVAAALHASEIKSLDELQL